MVRPGCNRESGLTGCSTHGFVSRLYQNSAQQSTRSAHAEQLPACDRRIRARHATSEDWSAAGRLASGTQGGSRNARMTVVSGLVAGSAACRAPGVSVILALSEQPKCRNPLSRAHATRRRGLTVIPFHMRGAHRPSACTQLVMCVRHSAPDQASWRSHYAKCPPWVSPPRAIPME